mgnify:CR=1 FL=1
MRQLDAGANVATIKIDTSAPYMKHMLANSFAEALSQLPKEKVVHCWAPLQESWDNRIELHTEASKDLARLFPNHAVDMGPTATEAEPEPTVDPTAGDDFDTDETDTNVAHAQQSFLDAVQGAIQQAQCTVADALRTVGVG